MWTLIFSIVAIGTHNVDVYNIKTYPRYIECFKQQQLMLPHLNPNESLNCVKVVEE